MLDYSRMSWNDLHRVLRLNPRDVPHYQRAQDALNRRFQFWGLVLASLAVAVAVAKLLIR